MAEQLKVAVAGPNWGAHHLRGVVESDHAVPVALWSRSDRPEARALADRTGIAFYTDYARMLEQTKPDVVTVATQEPGHAPLTIEALEHGAHVYCEKVISDSRDAAQRMIDAAAKADRQLNVGYNYRYSPSCRYLLDVVKQERIGRPLFAHLWAFTWCIHHMMDYANALLGVPQRVTAELELEPLEGQPHKSIYAPGHLFETFAYAAYTKKTCMVTYDSGATLMAGSTDYTSYVEPAALLHVQGSAGRAMVDDLTGQVTLWDGGRESTVFTPSQIADATGLVPNCLEAVKDFLRAIALGEPAPIPGEDGLNMLLLEEAIMRAAQSGQWEAVQRG